jgi:hypothetical protein
MASIISRSTGFTSLLPGKAHPMIAWAIPEMSEQIGFPGFGLPQALLHISPTNFDERPEANPIIHLDHAGLAAAIAPAIPPTPQDPNALHVHWQALSPLTQLVNSDQLALTAQPTIAPPTI